MRASHALNPHVAARASMVQLLKTVHDILLDLRHWHTPDMVLRAIHALLWCELHNVLGVLLL